jgi:hypothetical protein
MKGVSVSGEQSPAAEQGSTGRQGPACYRCGEAPAGTCACCGKHYCLEHGSWSDISAKGFCVHCLARRNVLRGVYAIVFVLATFAIIYWLSHL